MADEEIDVKGIDKAELLAALYNNSQPLGMGFLVAKAEPMTKAAAQAVLDNQAGDTYFDYLQGRVMKIDIGGDTLNTWGYDRDNGAGSVARVVADLKAGKFDAIIDKFQENAQSATAATYNEPALEALARQARNQFRPR